MDFGKRLKLYREKAGYSAREFAALIGIKYPTYAGYENIEGREPRYDTLIRIASALHCTIDELLGYKLDEYDELKAAVQHAGYHIKEKPGGIIEINIDEIETHSPGFDAAPLHHAKDDIKKLYSAVGIKEDVPERLVYPTKKAFCKAVGMALVDLRIHDRQVLRDYIARRFAYDYRRLIIENIDTYLSNDK